VSDPVTPALRDQATMAQDDAEWSKRRDPSRKEAPESLLAIMRRIWRTPA